MSKKVKIATQIVITSGEPDRKVSYSQVDFDFPIDPYESHTEVQTVRLFVSPARGNKLMFAIFHKEGGHSEFMSIIPYDTILATKEELISLFEKLVQDIKDMEG